MSATPCYRHTMSQRTFPFWQYLAPRFWPTWLGIGLLRLIVLLPYRVQLWLGTGIGLLSYLVLPRRRQIVRTNVRLAFPHLNAQEQQALVKANFRSTSIAAMETPLAWWGSEHRLRQLYHIDGWEHLHAAQALGKGVILLGGHFTAMLICGRLLAYELRYNILVKPAHNDLFEALMLRHREQAYGGVILSDDLRSLVRSLKRGEICWYSPDQDFGRTGSVFAPFMGVPTATLTATARLAKLSGAPIVPINFERLPQGGYRLRFLPAWTDFPSGDDVADATRINRFIENHVHEVPEQYLWGHRRFKTRPHGETSPYRRRKQ